VSVTSSPGKGSRFVVTLPWDAAHADDGPEHELGSATPALSHVLIIDDSQPAAEQLSRYMADLGCLVTVHERAGGALDLAARLGPDLIVLDVLLPDQTGWSVLRQLKADARTAGIPVLVVSVVDEPDLARRLGAEGHLLKPIGRSDLLIALRQIARPQGAPAAPRPAGKRIMLAEDNEGNIRMILDYLPLFGYEIMVARDGSEALQMARELRPAAILMDIQMPVMDGIEATRRIRADVDLCDTPVIALTALAMPGDRDRCIEAGADDYLVKPVSLRELPGHIEAAIRARGGIG
jgi:CheY-like chemotaxis protein